MKPLAILLLCVLSVAAQTTKPNTPTITKGKSSLSCQAEKKKYFDAWHESLDAWGSDYSELQAEKQKNAELEKKYSDALTVLRVLDQESQGKPLGDDLQKALAQVSWQNDAPGIAANLERTHQEWSKLFVQALKHDSDAVDKYNSLLSDYKDYVQRVGIQLAEIGAQSAYQQRVNKALLLYQLMPKYTPPQTINLQVTDCTRFPVLCVH